VIFNRFSHPCPVIDVLDDVKIGVLTSAIVVEAVFGSLPGVFADITICFVSGVAVEVSTDLSVNALAAVMATLEPESFEEESLFS